MLHLVKTLILFGIILLLVGLLLFWGQNLGIPLGKLPGDFHWQKGNSTIHFPLVTALLVSLFLTIFFSVIRWLFRR